MAAVTENGRKMERIIAVLKREIGPNDEITISELSVGPRFKDSPYNLPGSQRVPGYRVVNTVQVQTSNMKAVARLLDLALQAGANDIERVQLTLKDPEAAQTRALQEASAKARARATAMAEAQGLRVGSVISVSEGERDDPSSFVTGGGDRWTYANTIATVVESGSVEVTAAVTVLFALETR